MLCVIYHNKKLLHKILTFIQSLIYIAGLEKVTFLQNKKKFQKLNIIEFIIWTTETFPKRPAL